MAGSTIDAIQKTDNEVSILKTDDDKRLVFGWASISITVDGEQLEDRQQDMIDPEDLEEAAYEYVLNFRDTGEEHIPTMRKKGKLVESCVFTEEKQRAMGIPAGTIPIGWWIGFKIEDDDAWERVKNGTYRMFSIEGKANREPVEKGQLRGCGVIVMQDGKILTGTRIERGGRGRICGPGGHIEDGETPEEAAKREAMEEFGITCQELTPLGTLKDGTSAVFLCSEFTGTPKTDEKEMTEAKWRTIEDLRGENLFTPFEQSLELLDAALEKSDKEESEEKVAKTFHEILGISSAPARTIEKHHPDRFDHIEEVVEKSDRYDHIEEVKKYNDLHDRLGRFAPKGAAGATNVPFEGKAIITAARTSKANVDKNVAKVRGACSNEYSPIAKESVNMSKVKERGGCDDAEAKKCVDLADHVFSKAAAAEPQITKDIVSVVGGNGGKMYGLDFRLKQTTSMAGKIAADAKEAGISVEQAAGAIKDAVRYTAVFDSKGFVGGYNAVKSKLQAQGYEEVRCKNYFQKYEDGTSCQKAVQCVYKNKSGQMFELQFHTYETQGAKEVNHKYYEEQRAVGTTQRRSKALNDAMTKISSYSEVPDGVLGIKSHG